MNGVIMLFIGIMIGAGLGLFIASLLYASED